MELVSCTLRSIFSTVLFPPSIFILIILIYIFYKKNRKISEKQNRIIGDSVESAIGLTLSQFVFGVLGGIIGSIILNISGIVFDKNCRIEILFLVSLIFMFIKPRFICFSYSASFLGGIGIICNIISNILPHFNYENAFKVDIFSIMIFVGVMHVVEGILVFFDGHRGAVPIYIEKEGDTLKGYSMRRYWAFPMSIIIMGGIINYNGVHNSIGLEHIPYYWNIIKSQDKLEIIKSAGLFISFFYAITGYSTKTYTMTKKEKAHSSGMHIFSYGIILIIISQIARIGIAGEIIVVIFSPAAHEFMLNIQRKREERRYLEFVNDEKESVKKFKDVLENESRKIKR